MFWQQGGNFLAICWQHSIFFLATGSKVKSISLFPKKLLNDFNDFSYTIAKGPSG
jgi:hypothetical protein